MSSLFGTPSVGQQQQPFGGVLGATQNQNQQPTNSIMGSTPQQLQPKGLAGMFGGALGTGAGTGTGLGTGMGLGTGIGLGTGTGMTTSLTGGGLFGAPPLFSASTTNQNQNQPQGQAQGAGSNMFGSLGQTTMGGGGLAGGMGANMNTNQQQQPQQTGSLFGSSTQPTTGLGGMFGNLGGQQQQQQGQQPAGSSLFSNLPPPQNQNQQAPTLGSLFAGTGGNLNPNANPNTNTNINTNTNNLFGKPPLFGGNASAAGGLNAAPLSNMFSGTQNQSQPLGGGGGLSFLGQAAAQNQGQQQQPGQLGSSLFGQTPQQQQQQPGQMGGSLFGQPPQQQQGSSGFAPSLFGQSVLGQSTLQQPQKPANTLFGSSIPNQQPSRTGGLFGSSVAGAGGSLLGRSAIPGPQEAQAQFAALMSKIEAVAGGWGVTGPAQSRFQHYFYNLVDPSEVRLYGRPPNARDDAAWARAVTENPDPSCMVPALAVGFDDLQERVNAQSQQAAAHEAKLKELQTRIQALKLRHTASNTVRLQRASATQTQLMHRILKLVQHLHLLIPSVRSSAMRPEEEKLRVLLEEIEDELKNSIGSGFGLTVGGRRMRGRLTELWALVSALKAARDRELSAGGTVEWAVVDEEAFGQIAQILHEQQTGLSHLTKVLQKDVKDLGVILGSSGQVEDGKVGLSLSLSTT